MNFAPKGCSEQFPLLPDSSKQARKVAVIGDWTQASVNRWSGLSVTTQNVNKQLLSIIPNNRLRLTSAVVCSQFEPKYTLKGQVRNKKCRTASSGLKNPKITTFSTTQENVLWCMNYIREPCCRPVTSRFFISSICGSNSLDSRLDICACNVCRFFVFSTFCIILIFFTLLLILTIFWKKCKI